LIAFNLSKSSAIFIHFWTAVYFTFCLTLRLWRGYWSTGKTYLTDGVQAVVNSMVLIYGRIFWQTSAHPWWDSCLYFLLSSHLDWHVLLQCAGHIHEFHIIPSYTSLPTHRSLITTDTRDPLRSHLVPFAAVLNTLMGLARRCGGDLYEPGPLKVWNQLRGKMREAIKRDLDSAGQGSLCDVLMECLDLVNRILVLYSSAQEKSKKYSRSSRFDDMAVERGGSFDDGDSPQHADEYGPLGGRATPTPQDGRDGGGGEKTKGTDAFAGSTSCETDLAAAWRETNATPPSPSTRSKTSSVRQRIWSSLKIHIPRTFSRNPRSNKENPPPVQLSAAKMEQLDAAKEINVAKGVRWRHAFAGLLACIPSLHWSISCS
jgi:hypothetical protein